VSLVEACRQTGCERFVHAGSSSEYGFKGHAPHEEEPVEPNSAYAVAKAAATLYCRHAATSGELNAVTLRLYSVYGPYEDPRRLLPRLIACGLRGELPPLANPDVSRDFLAVEDAVEAMVLAAEHFDHVTGAIYNVGSGRQTTIRDLVALARRKLGVDAEPAWGSACERAWDTTTWVADTRRAARELGWRPRTALEEGFEGTVEWLRSNPAVWETYGISG
jgi:dolichol-phosphate mannosyltransferase